MDVSTPTIRVKVHAPTTSYAIREICTPDALRFVGYLCDKFEVRRQNILKQRQVKALEYDSDILPSYPKETEMSVRNNPHWKCAEPPLDILDRRVEITGPVDRKMVINGLNSGANVYMADFEDSTSPTFTNIIEGQLNLRDANQGIITYTNPNTGKVYKLSNNGVSKLFVRPRGWHLNESHITVNGRVASGSLVDFGLYFFHNVYECIGNQNWNGIYFYVPKLEGYLEARLWNDVFIAAQKYMGVAIGTIRATALLETITAAFEMEEILYELREHSIGLNCGRWDYLFSYIKKLKLHKNKITPDRSHLTMTTPLMEAYVTKLVHVCHKRGTFAMGGMSAAIPIKNDPTRNEAAMKKIEADKVREVKAGHDGTWVAHPALVKVAKDIFDSYMKTNNQITTALSPNGANVTESDLLKLPSNIPYGKQITSNGLSKGIYIVLAYTEAWLRGIGCIPLNNAMEDAATAEISRAQIWSWQYHGIKTQDDNLVIDSKRIHKLITKHVNEAKQNTSTNNNKWQLAGQLVGDMLTKSQVDDFLTSVCYPHILTTSQEGYSSLSNNENDLNSRL